MSKASRFEAAVGGIEPIVSEVRDLHSELEDWYDGMSGTNLEETATYSELEQAIDDLDTVIECLEEAQGVSVEFPVPFGRKK